ncbi:MAG: hypothetical protein CME70_06075 [Halobacteriovorax sp.]|nr:hypothetical protein [Halobacteriovorax sp.]|tara:strand:- start:3012 stop:3821 length:810 start_codon:yes stop_codon:yes gene_type:complete
MAIDFDAIRNKLNQLSGTSSRRNTMWRPQEGEEATVRLLSFPGNDGQPFKELWFYYNIGNNPGLLAPKQFGKPDPIQELINKLRDDASKDSYELAKKLYPKMRCFAPVVVRGEEDKGVRLWSFGKTVYQSLLNIMLDEDYGDITDPNDGRDVKVVCNKPPGRMWATTTVRPRGKATPLSSDPEQTTEWTNAIPNIDDMYTLKSYDELEKIVNDWLSGDTDDNSSDNVGTTRGPTVAFTETDDTDETTTSTKSNNQFRSLDEAFADLEDL